MGYRSEVAISFSQKAHDILVQKIFNLTDTVLQDEVRDLLSDAEIPTSNVYHWDWIKWYEETDEAVQFIMKTLSEFIHQNTPFMYIRLGEESGDFDLLETKDLTDVHEISYINQISLNLKEDTNA